ncbi:MAG: sulfurtransferase TusA family protein [Bacillota bacterium]
MEEHVLDVRGLDCPAPMLRAIDEVRRLRQAGVGSLIVIGDEAAAYESVQRVAVKLDCLAEAVSGSTAEWRLRLRLR